MKALKIFSLFFFTALNSFNCGGNQNKTTIMQNEKIENFRRIALEILLESEKRYSNRIQNLNESESVDISNLYSNEVFGENDKNEIFQILGGDEDVIQCKVEINPFGDGIGGFIVLYPEVITSFIQEKNIKLSTVNLDLKKEILEIGKIEIGKIDKIEMEAKGESMHYYGEKINSHGIKTSIDLMFK